MASRVYEAGTIITRVHALLRTGVLKQQPLWLAVVEAFPPFQPTQHNHTAQPGRAPQVLYPEDELIEEFSKTKTVSPRDVWRLSGEPTVEERYIGQQVLWMRQGKDQKEADKCTLMALKSQGVDIKTTKSDSGTLMKTISNAKDFLEEHKDTCRTDT